ncbi:MAG: hypothetical protein WBA74_17940 [Cyclobacteriaceae bacterium]
MGNTSKRILGVTAGTLVTILAGLVFYRSVNAGNPNYKMLIMACGMAFFLLFLVFSKNISKRNKRK